MTVEKGASVATPAQGNVRVGLDITGCAAGGHGVAWPATEMPLLARGSAAGAQSPGIPATRNAWRTHVL